MNPEALEPLDVRNAAALPRWQLPVFDLPAARVAEPPTAEEIDRIEETAYREGLERGYREGHAQGLRAAQTENERLRGLIEHIARPLAHLDEEVERSLVALAAAVARQVLQAELRAEPAHIETLTRELLRALPPQTREVRLQLHPEDIPLVQDRVSLPELRELRLEPDPSLARGDCRVLTEAARIDGRLDTRLALIAQSLSGDGA
ncbi:MAG TPA: FliH/SctL family protein [Solimonas sp.]|nr:FliH/SctL family protein [Solimonas sp.]